MKRIIYMLVIIFTAACSMQATHVPSVQPTQTPSMQGTQVPTLQANQVPTITKIPDSIATLFAINPSLEATFDGRACEISASGSLKAGDHILLLHNQSGQRTFLIVGRLYPGKSWDDFLQWFADNCGPPGSDCKRESGEAPWISWLFEVTASGQDSPESRYKYRLNEGQYLLIASRSDGSNWPCGSFQVAASQ